MIYAYHGTTKDNRRFTVAVNNGNVGIAICNPGDQFVKKVGFAKASGRALKKGAITLHDVADNQEQVDQFMQHPGTNMKALGDKISKFKAHTIEKIFRPSDIANNSAQWL